MKKEEQMNEQRNSFYRKICFRIKIKEETGNKLNKQLDE